jgi:hypothetical protein
MGNERWQEIGHSVALFCKGCDQLLNQGLGGGCKGMFWEVRNSGLCSAKHITTCGSGCRMVARGSSYHSPIFCLIMMKVGAEDHKLG